MTMRRVAARATCALLGLSAILVAAPAIAAKAPVIVWAQIDEDASIVRGKGVERASRASPRTYHVFFERNVQKCSVIVSAVSPNRILNASPIFDDLAPEVKNGIAVNVNDLAGSTVVTSAFYLQVTC